MKEENNVFRELQEENEVAFNDVQRDIKRNIEGRRGIWAFIGGIIDLYVPKVFETLLGGEASPDAQDRVPSDERKG